MSLLVSLPLAAGLHRRRVTRTLVGLSVLFALASAPLTVDAAQPRRGSPKSYRGGRKLDDELTTRAARGGSRRSRVIVRLEAGQNLPANLQQYVKGQKLNVINAFVLDLPDSALNTLSQGSVHSAHVDRPIWAADYLSTHSTAANVVQDMLGFTGAGIGVAVIDSGITTWHDDLTAPHARRQFPYGNQRVSKFVDFINGQKLPYDDHGHGSHVAGIILGNGYDSDGKQAGMAPDASLVALKVLDKQGKGTISNIISALDWVVANAKAYNIRVVNVSAGAGVTESYWTDPLTLAAKRVVDAGIVVVAAAGNLGMNAEGEPQYGGILCPANAPWVITVGASSTLGTVRRKDDQLAPFSSMGPTRGDYLAKPDLLAPGHGILSLAVPGSTLYAAHPNALVQGNGKSAYPAYLSLSGTSMAAPQVAGAVALMLQANPHLTPNFVKAILQYTAQDDPDYNPLQEGAGFLDVLSAVRLSAFYAQNKPGAIMPVMPTWSQHIIWGTHEISGGYLSPLANAWSTSTVWGAEWGSGEDNIVWGTACQNCDHVVWSADDADGDNIVWGTEWDYEFGEDNIVWGTEWDYEFGEDNIVWGTTWGDDDNIVWGTHCGGDNCHNVVWGAEWDYEFGEDNIVWGTDDDDNIVWGTDADDNIVWGTEWDYEFGEDNIVWGTEWDYEFGEDNIVWGTEWDYEFGEDNIVWGTEWDYEFGEDNIVWGTNSVNNVLWGPGGIFSIEDAPAQPPHKKPFHVNRRHHRRGR